VGAHQQSGSADDDVLSTRTGRDLLGLFDRLTSVLPWRLNDRSFPLIVLEPGDATADTGAFLDALESAADSAGIAYISPRLGDGAAGSPALSLIDTLAERQTWNGRRAQFGRFRFPRSELVKSFDGAVATARADGWSQRPPHQRSAAAMAAWNERTALFRMRGGTVKKPGRGQTRRLQIGGFAAAVLTILSGGIAEQTSRYILVTLTALVCVALLLLTMLITRGTWLLSRLGFRSRLRWFATSSFFAVLGGYGFDGRLQRVFDRLVADDEAEFRLQMKTFAFLEDLRDNYRKLAPSLRGFKRSTPPVVFLRDITAGNGGVELLSAMSDIRSRRSEFHTLLVVASVDAGHRKDLSGLPEVPPPQGSGEPRESLLDRYERWSASLSTAQAPSQNVPLPWLLRLPIRSEQPSDDEPAPTLTFRRRPRWTWLWSWWCLVVTVLVLAAVTSVAQTRLRAVYCHVGYPLSWSTDTRLRTDTDLSRECIGVATDGGRFERRSDGKSVGLDGDLRDPDDGHRGGLLTLADLQKRIDDENAAVLGSGAPYATVIYAGILTAASGKHELAVSGVKELAGAYLAQMRNNETGQPGEVGNPLKIRLLAANVGQDMAFSSDAVDRILDLARRDRTVVGVVGMARNTNNSQAAIRRLNDAGLPVIGTVNSSDELPALPHFYGLAATDFDEAAALRPAIQRELGKRPIDRALFVSRDAGPSQDVYSGEIASDAEKALRPRMVDRLSYVGTNDISSKMKAACENAGSRPYTLVYFAGRAEDLSGLMNGLAEGGCTQRKLVLLAGDEVATARFGTAPHEIPLYASITVYFTTFAYLPNLIADDRDQQNAFFLLARNLLGIGAPRVTKTEPLFVDAQMALTYDAASALSQAAQNAFSTFGLTRGDGVQVPGSGAVTSGAVLLELRRLHMNDGATGDIDFCPPRSPGSGNLSECLLDHMHNGLGNKGLTLVRVALRSGLPDSTPVCGRLAGGQPPLRNLAACPR
jgi:ABC-type branched-subunit amino acid transport system substrate-binding protein